jgi:hypothetical protein
MKKKHIFQKLTFINNMITIDRNRIGAGPGLNGYTINTP